MRIYNKFYCDESFFDNIDTEAKAYFLGLIVADGNVFKNYISIGLQEEDGYILELFKKYIQYEGNIYFVNKKVKNWKNQYRISISSNRLCKSLAQLGVIPAKTNFTYFPDIPEELWHHFIRGVFDGDGWLSIDNRRNKTFGIIGNKELIEKIQEILVNKCKLKKNSLYTEKHCSKNIVKVKYSGNTQIIRVFNYLYKDATVYLTRKYEKFLTKKEKL